MKQQRFTDRFAALIRLAASLRQQTAADALLILLDGPTDWQAVASAAPGERIVAAAARAEALTGAVEAGLLAVVSDAEKIPVFEQLTQALLESVADDLLAPSASVIAVYSAFEDGEIDSVSFIQLDEHLGRLTARDLRQIETSVPLDTLRSVVELAVDIGREGREGHPVGTMFVVGDTRKVLSKCRPAGFDPVRGYSRQERTLSDSRVREAIKEIAQLDGAFVVSSEGTVEKACQIVEADHANLTLSKGLGARHWAAAAISKNTNALAVVVSESNGTVRLFKGGEVILRIEPFRRAMKWRDFETEAALAPSPVETPVRP